MNTAKLMDYLLTMLPGVILAVAVYAAAFAPRRRRLERMGLVSSPAREVFFLLFLVYCFALAMVLLLPSDFHPLRVLREGYDRPFFRPGTISVKFMRTHQYSQFELLANVALFAPLGFFPALLWRDAKWYGALILAIMIPSAVENWQLFVGRTFDVNDLALNAFGVMVGWFIWNFMEKPALHCEEP